MRYRALIEEPTGSLENFVTILKPCLSQMDGQETKRGLQCGESSCSGSCAEKKGESR